MALETLTRSAMYALHRLSTDDYVQLYEQQIISPDCRTELINGLILDWLPTSPSHIACSNRLTHQLVPQVAENAIVSIKGSVQLDAHSQPQPDCALLEGRDNFYDDRYPTPKDVLLVIEISDGHLHYDRDTKGSLYAAAGIREFWIVDLQGECVEMYREPSPNGYRTKLTRDRPDTISSEALPDCQLALETILPTPDSSTSESPTPEPSPSES